MKNSIKLLYSVLVIVTLSLTVVLTSSQASDYSGDQRTVVQSPERSDKVGMKESDLNKWQNDHSNNGDKKGATVHSSGITNKVGSKESDWNQWPNDGSNKSGKQGTTVHSSGITGFEEMTESYWNQWPYDKESTE